MDFSGRLWYKPVNPSTLGRVGRKVPEFKASLGYTWNLFVKEKQKSLLAYYGLEFTCRQAFFLRKRDRNTVFNRQELAEHYSRFLYSKGEIVLH